MKELNTTIRFDMDGTFVNLYSVSNWLPKLIAHDISPYIEAQPLIRLNTFARILNNLQKKGYKIAIISWLAKNSNSEYDEKVRNAKLEWLAKHLPSVHWNEINIVKYGTPKENYCNSSLDVLFDDEIQNRENWTGIAYDVDNIIETLKKF